MSEKQIKHRLQQLWAWSEDKSPNDAPESIDQLINDVMDYIQILRYELGEQRGEIDDLRADNQRLYDERAYSPEIDESLIEIGVPTDLSIGQLLSLKQHLQNFNF